MFISVCTFKRTRRGTIERGIAIGADESDIQIIIDSRGERVSMISDYTIRPTEGCFSAELNAPIAIAKDS